MNNELTKSFILKITNYIANKNMTHTIYFIILIKQNKKYQKEKALQIFFILK